MPLLLEACPSFAERRWKLHVADAAYEEGLFYVDLGESAHHLVALVTAGANSEFAALRGLVGAVPDGLLAPPCRADLGEAREENVAERFVVHRFHETAHPLVWLFV